MAQNIVSKVLVNTWPHPPLTTHCTFFSFACRDISTYLSFHPDLSLSHSHSLTHSLSLSGFWLATTPTTKSRGHTSPPHVLNMLLVSPLTSPSLPSLSVWSYGFLPRNPSYIPNKSSRDVDAKMSKILRLLSFISIVIKWLVQSILRH